MGANSDSRQAEPQPRTHTDERVARVLSAAANALCSCGGAGPSHPAACAACQFYHRVRTMLGVQHPGW